MRHRQASEQKNKGLSKRQPSAARLLTCTCINVSGNATLEFNVMLGHATKTSLTSAMRSSLWRASYGSLGEPCRGIYSNEEQKLSRTPPVSHVRQHCLHEGHTPTEASRLDAADQERTERDH